MLGNSISIGLVAYLAETVAALRAVPELTSVVEVFPDNTDSNLRRMLVAYTESDPAPVAEMVSKMNNIEYAWATPPRRLVMPV